MIRSHLEKEELPWVYDFKIPVWLHLFLQRQSAQSLFNPDARARKSGCVLYNSTVHVCGQPERKRNNNSEGTMLVYRSNVYVVYILSTVKTENTDTPGRMEALVQKLSIVTILQSSSFHSYHLYHPGFEAQASSQATVFAIHPNVWWRDLRCSSCPLDLRIDVTLVPLMYCQASYFDVFEPAWSPAL